MSTLIQKNEEMTFKSEGSYISLKLWRCKERLEFVNFFQEFLRQQAEYRARQEQLQREQQQRELQQREQQQQIMQQQQNSLSVKDTVRDIIANTDFGNLTSDSFPRPRSPSGGRSRIIQVGDWTGNSTGSWRNSCE